MHLGNTEWERMHFTAYLARAVIYMRKMFMKFTPGCLRHWWHHCFASPKIFLSFCLCRHRGHLLVPVHLLCSMVSVLFAFFFFTLMLKINKLEYLCHETIIKHITAVIYGFRNKLECLTINSRLGWKGLPGTNTETVNYCRN